MTTWPSIPISLEKALSYSLGNGYIDWVRDSTKLGLKICKNKNLTPTKVLTGGAMSLVTLVQDQEGNSLVLKIPSDPQVGRNEFRALLEWSNNVVPDVSFHDEASGAFLMTYLHLTSPKLSLDLILNLLSTINKKPTKYEFPNATSNIHLRYNWAEQRFPPFSSEMRDCKLALSIFETSFSKCEKYLLHGDFQNKNIFSPSNDETSEKLLTLDPLPVVGHKLFDLAFWISTNLDIQDIDSFVSYCSNHSNISLEELQELVWIFVALEFRPSHNNANGRSKNYLEKYRSHLLKKYTN